MVILNEKGPPMPRSIASNDDLEEVRELNRLFLEFLRTRACAGEDCLGLGRRTLSLLASAAPARLDAAAEFPRALFRLRLGQVGPVRVLDPCAEAGERLRQALQLTILHSAWNMSRRSAYGALLFLGLDDAQVRRLRMMPLSDLPAMSATSDLIGCGFLEAPWLWRELLTETRPESRRQLLLIGLQPQLDVRADIALLQRSEQASA
jgi:hypothetical protein